MAADAVARRHRVGAAGPDPSLQVSAEWVAHAGPINPQRVVLDNGVEWSQCSLPVSFEAWELAILARLTNEVLPATMPNASWISTTSPPIVRRGPPRCIKHSAWNSRPIG